MALRSFLMLVLLALCSDIKCSTTDKMCPEGLGHDLSMLLQKTVGVQGTLGRTALTQNTMPVDVVRAKLAEKQGMNANSRVESDTLDLFTNLSSWFWTYSLAPNPKSVAWAQENNKEFVPLVSLKRVLPKEYGSCSFKEGTCTVDALVKVLEETKKKVTTRYLMGFNEPYASHQEASSYKNKAAKSVNGTEGISSQKAAWMIEFLKACYDNKDADPPCNVEKIKVFSVHEYKCYAAYWQKYASLDGGDDVEVDDSSCNSVEGPFKSRSETNIYVALKQAMRDSYGDTVADEFWDPYFNRVKLWVTETSCSGDIEWNKKSTKVFGVKDKSDLPATPTAEQSCQYMTGQSCQRKEGSIAALLALDNVERFSWFTLMPAPPLDHPNYESIMAGAMTDAATGKARPPGRALLSALDPTAAKCSGGA